MTVTTRWAVPADEDALAALDAVAWDSRSGFPSMSGRGGPFFSESTPPSVVLVAELDGAVVGYLKLKPWTPLEENAHVLGLQGIATLPSARGRGVGTALLRAAEAVARARGARKIWLGVFGTNPRAQALYAREGYVVEGVRRGEWCIDGVDVDDVLMARYLE